MPLAWFSLALLSCDFLDITPPDIKFISPSTDTEYFGTIPVELKATDNRDVDKVELFLDGESIYEFSKGPYKTDLDLDQINKSSITLKATAHDKAGNWKEAVQTVVVGQETIKTPNTPSGSSNGTTNTPYIYSTGGSSSNAGHSLEYRFDWDDGDTSNWSSSTTDSNTWASAGTYLVKAQARCAIHTSVVSNWSSSKTATINESQTTDFEAPFSSAIPTIDGVLNTSEWADANEYSITLVRQDGADSHAGTLYLQHDNTWLYLGVNSGFGSGWDVHWVFRFDGNHDHILAGSASEPHIDLQFNYPTPGAWSGYNGYWYLYGTSDAVASEPPGTARASVGTDPVTYEFNVKIPDLGSEPGQIIGFYTYHGSDGTAEHGYLYPEGTSLSNPGEWAHIKLLEYNGGIKLAASYDTPGNAYGVYVTGGHAYVADGESGLQIINVSNPASPTMTGSYDTPSSARDVYAAGGTAYVANFSSGLQVIDVSNPASPTLAGGYDTPDIALDVYVTGGYAYVANNFSGLLIINVSNPASPTLVGSYNTPGNAYGVYVTGGHAYVADGLSGLRIINVSNPANPTLAGSYNTPGQALGVFVAGGTAYVADLGSGLQVIDVSNPANPALAGSYNTPGSAMDVYVSGGYAYVADGNSGLQIIYVSNPTSPTLAGSYDTPGYAGGVFVTGGYAYVADGSSGLLNFDISGLP